MNNQKAHVAEPAPLWLRLMAAVYDLLPLLAIWFFTASAALGLMHGDLDYHSVWYRLALLTATAGYFVLSWIRGGQTVGMKAWRLRVIRRDDGMPLNATRALLRFAVACISLAILGFGFIWALFDRERRTWHDIAARSMVMRLPQ